MFDALGYSFVQNAIMGAILSSIVCGIIGTIIVQKRLVMLSGGIAHASFGGIGLGYLMGIEPIIPGLLFAVASALAVSGMRRSTGTNSDALTGMFWSSGMALGILFIAVTPGYPPDMTSYLFGDILTISRSNVTLMAALVIIVTASVFSFFSYWKSFLFDDEFSAVMGMNVRFFENALFILVAMSVVALIKVVGIILVIALLTIPPSIAALYTYNLKAIMVTSILIGCIACLLGLYVSYMIGIPSGAVIVLFSSFSYFVCAFTRRKAA
ncbi:zinc transport system permease protein [Peptoclostridium litorale DSM 5388]|uniref:Uncharacterized protein n=1 Tax=Peptoclostridium litorale DSM 5388 TaxID=1121324 RepID=A0A069RBF2_PEPLI|nr:metal ABC transporter permease [Peptoclostridium litorale]KDR94399.1 hypothetical protein CLIT_20c00440 [Peptoclostridium litorale DSM 5388]SIO24521.1 zinc transport system permease protein [Peptoclostridium litorale DSM 5388]